MTKMSSWSLQPWGSWHSCPSASSPCPVGMVYTGDTDVVIILLSNFHHIKALNATAEIWICFKTGKTSRMISLNSLTTKLRTETCKAMALFHVFTGSDSTSSFKFRGKRSCCKLMHEVPQLTEEFATIVDTPFQTSPRLKEVAINFVCIKWGKWCWSSSNEAILTEDERCWKNPPNNGCFGSTSQKECLPIVLYNHKKNHAFF